MTQARTQRQFEEHAVPLAVAHRLALGIGGLAFTNLRCDGPASVYIIVQQCICACQGRQASRVQEGRKCGVISVLLERCNHAEMHQNKVSSGLLTSNVLNAASGRLSACSMTSATSARLISPEMASPWSASIRLGAASGFSTRPVALRQGESRRSWVEVARFCVFMCPHCQTEVGGESGHVACATITRAADWLRLARCQNRKSAIMAPTLTGQTRTAARWRGAIPRPYHQPASMLSSSTTA